MISDNHLQSSVNIRVSPSKLNDNQHKSYQCQLANYIKSINNK